MELMQTLPSKYQRRVKTTGELIEERGYKKGKMEGKAEGKAETMEWFIRQYLLKYPQEGDEGVSYLFSVPLELVKKVRQAIREEIN